MTPSGLSVDEDAPRGFSVASVKAYGRKVEDVHYSMAGGDLGGSFQVDKVSGSVFVNGTLDYERVERYELWVSAFYSSKPLYSVAKVKTTANCRPNQQSFQRFAVSIAQCKVHACNCLKSAWILP